MNTEEQKKHKTSIDQLRADVKTQLENHELDITTIVDDAVGKFKQVGEDVKTNVRTTCDGTQASVDARAVEILDELEKLKTNLEERTPKKLPGWRGLVERLRWVAQGN